MIVCWFIAEILITAPSENIGPVPIEDKVKKLLPCISNCLVIGDKRRFLSMLITLKASQSTDYFTLYSTVRRAGLVLGWVTVCNQPTGSTQTCIPPGSLNQVIALIVCSSGRNATFGGWQVTQCDPMIWHVSSRSGEACL